MEFHRYCQERIEYQGELAYCGFEAWRLANSRLAVRFTEYPDNPGRSVTNAIEQLASFAARALGAKGATLIVAEHYLHSPARRCETIDEVALHWTGDLPSNPEWICRDSQWWLSLVSEGERVLLPPVLRLQGGTSPRGGGRLAHWLATHSAQR